MTHSIRRTIALLTLTAGLLVAAPGLAGATAPTDIAQPFIEIQEVEAEEETLDWTYRFLIPSVIALTILLIGGTVVMYFVRVVRGRYRVVE